jgi:transcriptional regulator with XRE-family HTH domain
MKAIPSNSTAAAVRAYFGLSQVELAQYLGITRGQVAHVEAGRRSLSRSANLLLNRLADLLPPPLGEGPPAPDSAEPAAGLLDPHPLRRQQRKCAWKAAKLRQALEKLDANLQLAQRWQQVLPQLRAVGPLALPAAQNGRTQRWLDDRAAEVLDHLDGAEATARVILRLRIEHLEAEAAKLAQLLAHA